MDILQKAQFPDQQVTHEVFNQSSPLENYNPATADAALRSEVFKYQGEWGWPAITQYGERTGRAETILLGFQANAHKPEFQSHDRFGHRIDRINYHPAYYALMKMSLEEGQHADTWINPKPGAHAVRAAKIYLQTQLEPGHGCPLTMTFAAVPALKLRPVLAAIWLPKILTKAYDPRDISFPEKVAVTIGMGMTEKQGGSDVRSNTTKAKPLSTAGERALFELTGHKWFLSAPMCDAFLMLAQTPEGLSCFLAPRRLEGGQKNAIEIQRLKNKMGNVSNASSEVELRSAQGWLIGEAGRGVSAILEMVALTRFDCMVSSSALQRQAVVQAIHHCRQRSAFGKLLIHQPLMQNVLIDLHLEQRGALALSMRMAAALDHPESEQERLLLRLGLAVGKYWICKRTPALTYEAMECLGGNGVMEDCIMPRLYREAPINAIWEGSGNIQALDILRTIHKQPEAIAVWFNEIEKVHHPLLQKKSDHIKQLLKSSNQEFHARQIADLLALSMQTALLLHDDEEIGNLFAESRLGVTSISQFGSLSLTDKSKFDKILGEALKDQ